MCQVTVHEAEHHLYDLMQKLKDGTERVVYIVRDDNTVAELTLSAPKKKQVQRLGIGKGRIVDPVDFDKWDEEVRDMFGEAL